MPGKLGLTTTQRKTVLRNLATDLIWYGKIETTLARAKQLRPYVEKIVTTAINSYTDTISETVTVKDAKGKDVTKKVFKDGPKKLAARRKIMALLHPMTPARAEGESRADYRARTKGINHPAVEKLFNELAPKFAERAEQSGQGGGYTQIYRLANRRGDDAEMAIIKFVD